MLTQTPQPLDAWSFADKLFLVNVWHIYDVVQGQIVLFTLSARHFFLSIRWLPAGGKFAFSQSFSVARNWGNTYYKFMDKKIDFLD